MGFKEAVTRVFNNYANFSGRARRSEFWFFALFTLIISAALAGLAQTFGQGFLGRLFTGLDSLFSLAVFIPSLAVAWRRLHDIGKSGANWCWIFLPLVGAIMLLVWYCRDSDPGENAYGPNPKENELY